MAPKIPFAPGSISFGHYTHDGLEPTPTIDTFIDQAVLAVRAGFDGVTISEHHAGFPTYLPNPLQATGWVLDAMPDGWAGPFPLLLPLRPPGIVVQELAWLEARYPHRITAGFAAGYVERDFDACGVPFADRNSRFRESLGFVAQELSQPTARFAGDRVVRDAAASGIPLLVAGGGPRAVARAAELGLGLGVPADDPSETHAQYIAAGGTGPRVLMRWVWLGNMPDSTLRSWEKAHGSGSPRIVSSSDPAEIANRLVHDMQSTASTALSLRVHLPAVKPEEANAQIEAIGSEVVPLVLAGLASKNRLLGSAGGVVTTVSEKVVDQVCN